MKVVKLKTYKLKTVDHINDKTIKICNLTVFGKLLKSDFESSNIILALSTIQFFNLWNINYSLLNITVNSPTLKPNFFITAVMKKFGFKVGELTVMFNKE